MTELGDRYIVQARLLGMDKAVKRRWKREQEFAIDVTLSDESNYTIFRRVKEITVFHAKLVSRFPVEAGYFNKSDMVIPDCPLKQTIFGPSRVIRNDRVFEKLLNSYFKEIPGLPTSIIKCNLISSFFALRGSDMSEPGQPPQCISSKPRKKRERVVCSKDSSISGPIRLRSYYVVADYKDTSNKFSIPEGTVVQVVQKDASGWWRVDLNGKMGWAPASFLVPVDDDDLEEEAKENKAILCSMRAGARYISTSAYQACRDDEVSFVRGAVVKLIKKYADGWWLVRYNGGEGYVPGSMFHKFDQRQATAYVKNIQRQFKNRRSTKIIPTIKPKWMGNPSTADGLMLYQCLAKYRASDSSELSMNKDDILKVLDRKDHGWWYVEEKHGRSGWAPATFLGPVVRGKKEKSDTFENGIVGSTYEVKQSYSAKVGDEVSAWKGDKVLVLSAPDNGWWIVKKVETNEQGLIPSLCFNEGTSGSTSLGTETETFESALDIPDPLQSLNTTEEEEKRKEKGKEEDEADSEEEEEEEKENGKEEEEAVEDEDAEGFEYYSDGDDVLLEDCYTATEDYTKQAQDELSVCQGQMVYVVDDSDEDMFYVVVDGKEGWIPASVLTPLSEEELEGGSNTSCNSRSQSRSCSPMPISSQRTGSPVMQSSRSPSSLPRQHRHFVDFPFRHHSPLRDCRSASPQPQRGSSPSSHQAHSPRSSQSPCLRYFHTPSRSPSPVSHLDEDDVSRRREPLQTPHIQQIHTASGEDLLSSTDQEVSRINKLQVSMSSSIEIRVEDHASVEEIERAAQEAEQLAQEAQRRAMELREMVSQVKRTFSSPESPLPHTD